MFHGDRATKDHKVAIYADAWGVRKLITHVLRNFRTDKVPRVPSLMSCVLRCRFCRGPGLPQGCPSVHAGLVSGPS